MDITAAITAQIKKCGLSVERVSHELGIDQSTFYRKLAGGSKKFTLEQIQCLIRVLQMSKDDATAIFFEQ